MESLQLPIDLCWNGKMEPDSPSSELFGLSSAEESWCFGDDFANHILLPNLDVDDIFPKDINKPDDILFEFEYEHENEQWLDVKNVQPMETSTYITEPQSNGYSEVQVVKLQNSELQLEKFCDVSELTQLTPPQTPPDSQNFITETDIYDLISQQANVNSITTKSVIEDIIRATSPASSYVDYSSDATNSPTTSNSDDAADIYIAQGSDIVDEILRTKAQDLPDCNDENSMYSNYSSGGMSLSTNDSEWTPSPTPSSSKCSDYDGHHKSSTSSSILNGGVTKKRVRPYSRNVDDKKSRKKEQNKNAATRYRQKKKLEMEEILEEERLLTIRNEELVRDATEIEREVKYLKKLIKEFFKAKYC